MCTAENTYHTYVHIVQNTNFIRKLQVITGGGALGVHSPCTLLLDPPLRVSL